VPLGTIVFAVSILLLYRWAARLRS
jgi:hypothetical protein